MHDDLPLGPNDSGWVKAQALAAGFDAVGIARAEALDPKPLDRVLARGAEGDLVWLRTQREVRLDPRLLLPNAKSVIALALAYPSADAEDFHVPSPRGRVARYARGRDYHAVMKVRLRLLKVALRKRDPSVAIFAAVDVAPVMEKAWAQRAGIGWVGKNGCLLTRDFGSYVFLATAIVDRSLTPDAPHADHCGKCQACLSACPTEAIPEPGFVDARRCLAALTIERRGAMTEEMMGKFHGWAFGCDICQEVCPWNRGLEPVTLPELQPRPDQSHLNLAELLRLSEDGFRARYNGTPLARARYDGMLRNALLLAGEERAAELHKEVVRHLKSPYPGVQAAAAWALARLETTMPVRPDPQGGPVD